MKQKCSFTKNEYYTNILKRDKLIDKRVLKCAKRIIWSSYINDDVPQTFAKIPQTIDNIPLFKEETYQLYSYLMEKHKGFVLLNNLKENEEYKLIEFMSPGRDKPMHLICWEKHLLATLCCGTAPTEEEFYKPSYNSIIDSLIKNKILPLIFLILIEIQKFGLFKIKKTTIELAQINKSNGKKFNMYQLNIIRIPKAPSPIPESFEILEERLNKINEERAALDNYIKELDDKLYSIQEKINNI